ncbi:hypothetical protein CXB51_001615 [Gossypium anomalum]|uniref:Integrase catalytic domain-containing protein n=1 Tax=Gossypium anomalum TaxID=47600 RepID=A0A8J6DC65_9ROSI|nr:hypothetical protein CXB51_001615 [Gossypium anomalum]
MSLDLLTEMLLDCEKRQIDLLTEAPLQANMVSNSKHDTVDHSKHVESSRSYSREYKPSHRSNGRGWSRGKGCTNGRGWSHLRPQCQLCGKIGHLVKTCYHRFDETYSRSLLLVDPILVLSPSSRFSDQVWYPDSGVTNHITPDVTSLSSVAPYTGTNHVSMGNGVSVPIANVGTTHMKAGTRLLHLQNVLHVPSVCKNLMSVGQFARDNTVYFEFYPFMCFVKDIQTRNTLLVGHMHEGLYRFDVSKPSLPATRVTSSSVSAHLCTAQYSSPKELWHRRLGHPCSSVLDVVLRNCNISFDNNIVSSVCSACQIGKAYKLPFSSSKTVRYTWIYFLKSKAKFLQCFLQFKQMVSIQFGRTIKSLQSDWGREYRSLSRELARLGIQHRVTCPHTSEQNRVAERKHRQVVDMGLTLMAQAGLPLDLWYYAFAHSVHLINRLPTPVLQKRSPYEVLYQDRPSYSYLKVLGCACYPCLRSYHRHKLQFRSAQCVFLGVGMNQKGYKCLDSSGRVFISRHVTFDESLFPFQKRFSLESLSQVDKSARCQSYFPVVQAEPVSVPLVSLSIPPSMSSYKNNNGQSASALETPTPFPGAQSSSTPAAIESSSDSPIQTVPLPNAHPMQTRSKSRIFKPKLFTSVLGDEEPTSITAALQHPTWPAAAHAEYAALLANHTWDIVPLPTGRKAVGCKWIFKLKRNADGSIAPHKGRLVVKGYLQKAGVDFQETFSSVAKPTSIRVVLALAVSLAPGLEQQGHEGQQLVCRLRKALYGLKQAPRAWFHKLKDFLLATGFVASKADSSLFVQRSGSQLLFVLVYVDDIIVTGNNSEIINGFI